MRKTYQKEQSVGDAMDGTDGLRALIQSSCARQGSAMGAKKASQTLPSWAVRKRSRRLRRKAIEFGVGGGVAATDSQGADSWRVA